MSFIQNVGKNVYIFCEYANYFSLEFPSLNCELMTLQDELLQSQNTHDERPTTGPA